MIVVRYVEGVPAVNTGGKFGNQFHDPKCGPR